MDNVETLDRPLMGVRAFRLIDDWLAGISLYGDYFRPDEPRRAECRDRGPGLELHAALDSEWCRCGYYAWYTLDSATRDEMLEGDVTGVVSAWGDVELHGRGFRSEWMQVEAIVWRDGDPISQTQAIADAYAVPFISESEIDSFCRERGEVMKWSESPREDPAVVWTRIQAEVNQSAKRMAERLAPILEGMKHPDGVNREACSSQRKPATSFQEAIERKRNKPAFWRERAGGDVHDGR